MNPYFGKQEIFGPEDDGDFDMTMEWGEFNGQLVFTLLTIIAPFY
jgi:hypothetical protein